MAKNEYDDIDDLYLDFEKDIQSKLLPNVGSKMKEIMKDTIDEVVFNQYIPSYYKRRKTGGLDDEENMKLSFEGINGEYEITMINTTKGNSNYSNAEGYTEGYISDIIEEGSGYGYDLDAYIGARPFQEVTQNIIDFTDYIDTVVDEFLKDWK